MTFIASPAPPVLGVPPSRAAPARPGDGGAGSTATPGLPDMRNVASAVTPSAPAPGEEYSLEKGFAQFRVSSLAGQLRQLVTDARIGLQEYEHAALVEGTERWVIHHQNHKAWEFCEFHFERYCEIISLISFDGFTDQTARSDHVKIFLIESGLLVSGWVGS